MNPADLPPLRAQPAPLAGSPPPASPPPLATSRHEASSLVEVEREHIARVLREAGWVIEGAVGAAARLGLRPSTLRSRMAKLQIRRP